MPFKRASGHHVALVTSKNLKGTTRGSIWVSDIPVNYTGSGRQEHCIRRNTRLIRVSLTTDSSSHDERSNSKKEELAAVWIVIFRQDVQYSARSTVQDHRGHVSE